MMKRNGFLGSALICGLAWSCANNNVAPTPVVSTSPSPSPTPPATTQCNLPPVNVEKHDCRYDPPLKFESVVVRAQEQVRREHPELFDRNGQVSQGPYTSAVAATIRSYGYCAIGGADDEVGVKSSNDFSELYDIVTSNGDTWTYYEFSCRPPLF